MRASSRRRERGQCRAQGETTGGCSRSTLAAATSILLNSPMLRPPLFCRSGRQRELRHQKVHRPNPKLSRGDRARRACRTFCRISRPLRQGPLDLIHNRPSQLAPDARSPLGLCGVVPRHDQHCYRPSMPNSLSHLGTTGLALHLCSCRRVPSSRQTLGPLGALLRCLGLAGMRHLNPQRQ